MAFQAPITIPGSQEHFRQKDFVLPATRCEFFWQRPQIITLIDSLFRGYSDRDVSVLESQGGPLWRLRAKKLRLLA